jgi:hypothetical protein
MTPTEVNARMAELAQRAARLNEGDPALHALLAELEALSRILPAAMEPDVADAGDDDIFENMPV